MDTIANIIDPLVVSEEVTTAQSGTCFTIKICNATFSRAGT